MQLTTFTFLSFQQDNKSVFFSKDIIFCKKRLLYRTIVKIWILLESLRHFHYCIMVSQARVVQILSRGRKVWLSNKTVVKAIIERFEYLLSKNCALISFHFLNVCPGFIKVIFAWLRRPSKFKTFIFSACSFSFTIIWKQEY